MLIGKLWYLISWHAVWLMNNVYFEIIINKCNRMHVIILDNLLSKVYKLMNVFNTMRPRQNCRHFADDTFNRIFVNENVRISIKFSLKFAPKGPINNIPALVQIMAWRRPRDKPLSGPVMVSLLTHICVTRPQWVNYSNCSLVRWFYNHSVGYYKDVFR